MLNIYAIMSCHEPSPQHAEWDSSAAGEWIMDGSASKRQQTNSLLNQPDACSLPNGEPQSKRGGDAPLKPDAKQSGQAGGTAAQRRRLNLKGLIATLAPMLCADRSEKGGV